MKSLLFIGGTGFLGQSFFEYLNKNSLKKIKFSKIIVVSRKTKKIKTNLKIKYIKKNILKLKKLPVTDYIIYAANSSKSQENIASVNNFFKILNESHKKTKILFTSSGAIYGPIKKKIKSNENDKISLKKIARYKGYKKEYARDKFFIEKIFKKLGKKGFKVSIARLFSFIGNKILTNKNYAISDIINQSQNRKFKFIQIDSTSRVYRGYMNTKDLIEWIISILMISNKKCPIFNVGSDEEITIQNLAKLISAKSNKQVIFKKTNSKIEDYYVPSILKAKTKLGLKIKNKISKSIKDIL